MAHIKKRVRIFLIISGILLLVFFIAQWIIQSLLCHRIESVLNKLDTVHHITIDKTRISLLSSSIALIGIQVSTDTTGKIFRTEDSLDFMAIDGVIKKFSITGISFPKLLFKKEIDANHLHLTDIQLSISIYQVKEAGKKVKKQELVSPIDVHFNQATFDLSSVTLRSMEERKSNNELKIHTGTFSFSPKSLRKNDTINMDLLENAEMKFKEISYVIYDSSYTVKCIGFNYQNKDSSLTADSVLFQPNFNEPDFIARNETETDRIDLAIHDVTAQKFWMDDFLRDGDLIAQFVSLGGMKLKAYRDKRKPDDHSVKPMLHDLISDYPHLINIDSVELKESYIEYKERAIDSDQPGKVHFTQLKGTIRNITNDSLKKDNTIYVTGQAMFLDRVLAKMELKIPVNASDNVFYCKGTMNELDVSELNLATENIAFVTLTAGRAHSMEFRFTANKYQSIGSMILKYDSVDFSVINKKTKDTTGLKEQTINFIAENFIINTSNPDKDGTLAEGTIDYKRNPEKFIINYCWKSIFSGVKSSIGLSEPPGKMKKPSPAKKKKKVS